MVYNTVIKQASIEVKNKRREDLSQARRELGRIMKKLKNLERSLVQKGISQAMPANHHQQPRCAL